MLCYGAYLFHSKNIMKLLTTLTILLSTLTNVNASQKQLVNDAYLYGLPTNLTNISINADNNFNRNFSTLYQRNPIWFNDELTSESFLIDINNFNNLYNINNDSLNRYYEDITGQTSSFDYDNIRLDINLVIGGYLDSNGNYIDLGNDKYTYYFTTIATLLGQSEYTYTLLNRNYNSIWKFTYTDNNSISSEPTTLTKDYLKTCDKIYIRGFFGANSNYYANQSEIDFLTQVGLYYAYGQYLVPEINDLYWYTDGYYNDYVNTALFKSFSPYLYIGISNNVNYYIYNYNSDYVPTYTVIYNGIMNINNSTYDTLVIHFKRLLDNNGTLTVNNATINLYSYESLLTFDKLYAFNSVNNSYIPLISANIIDNGDFNFSVSNTYYYNYTYDINYKNVYWYGTNYRIDQFYGIDISTKRNIINSDIAGIISSRTYNLYFINSINKRNYLENLTYTINTNNIVVGSFTDNVTTNILTNVFDLYGVAFTAITTFFNFTIFPGITLGLLLLVPLIVTIIITIVKLFKR